MKLTREEIFRLVDQFTDFLDDYEGQPATFKRVPGAFLVAVGSQTPKPARILTEEEARRASFPLNVELTDEELAALV